MAFWRRDDIVAAESLTFRTQCTRTLRSELIGREKTTKNAAPNICMEMFISIQFQGTRILAINRLPHTI